MKPTHDPDHYLTQPMDNQEAVKNREIAAIRDNHDALQRCYAEIKEACAGVGMERYCTHEELMAFLKSRLLAGTEVIAANESLSAVHRAEQAEERLAHSHEAWRNEHDRAEAAEARASTTNQMLIAFGKVLDVLGAPGEGADLNDLHEWAREYAERVAKAEAKIKELENLVSLGDKIALAHTRLISGACDDNAKLREALHDALAVMPEGRMREAVKAVLADTEEAK